MHGSIVWMRLSDRIHTNIVLLEEDNLSESLDVCILGLDGRESTMLCGLINWLSEEEVETILAFGNIIMASHLRAADF